MLCIRRFLLLALAVGAASCTPVRLSEATAANSVSPAKSPLVGTWIIKAMEETDAAGRTSTTHPLGMLVYTPGGRMAVQIMALPRPVVPKVPGGPDLVTAWTGEQARTVVETYDAYFGTYEVDDVRQIVTHHVQGELRASLVGSTYGRRFTIEGGNLVLSSTRPEEHWRVIWERAE